MSGNATTHERSIQCVHASLPHVPVVLVDDDDRDYFLICRLLQGAGVAAPVVRFSSVPPAVEYLECEQQFGRVPRLVFLSTGIRAGNVFNVLESMRSRAAFDATKVVVISRAANPTARDRAAALRAEYCEVRLSSSALEQVLAKAVEEPALGAGVQT